MKEIERYNKIQEDLLKEQQKQEQEELESISAIDEDEEELPELTPSETQSVQNMGLDEDGEVVSKGKLDVALDYLRSNTVEAQRQMVEEEEEALAKMHEEEEALRLERERQSEIEEYMRLDPVNSHANLIMMDGMNESLLHGASPPAKTPQRLVSISPVYRNKRWQNAAAVLIQSVWRGTHFRRVNKLMLVALQKLRGKHCESMSLLKCTKKKCKPKHASSKELSSY